MEENWCQSSRTQEELLWTYAGQVLTVFLFNFSLNLISLDIYSITPKFTFFHWCHYYVFIFLSNSTFIECYVFPVFAAHLFPLGRTFFYFYKIKLPSSSGFGSTIHYCLMEQAISPQGSLTLFTSPLPLEGHSCLLLKEGVLLPIQLFYRICYRLILSFQLQLVRDQEWTKRNIKE